MQNFNKIIRIGTQLEWNSSCTKEMPANVYCEITYKDRKLSISGVVAPMSNGDCRGGCGQIVDDIKVDDFATGWDQAKLEKFVEIWQEWHLNDMKAYSVEMKAAGWDKLASKKIYKHSLIRTDENQKRFEKLEKDIIAESIKDKSLTLTDEDKRLLKSERFQTLYSYNKTIEAPEFMGMHKDWKTKQPEIERKTLGWVDTKEHKDGLLCRKLHPGDKHGYGQKWFFHEVPTDVLEWLYALPNSDKRPAWI